MIHEIFTPLFGEYGLSLTCPCIAIVQALSDILLVYLLKLDEDTHTPNGRNLYGKSMTRWCCFVCDTSLGNCKLCWATFEALF